MKKKPKVGEYWFCTNQAGNKHERHYIIRFTKIHEKEDLRGFDIVYVIEWSTREEFTNTEIKHNLKYFYGWTPMHKSSKEELKAYQLLKKLL